MKRILTALLNIFIFCTLFAQDCSKVATLNMATVYRQPGEIVMNIPITVSNFSDIISFSFRLSTNTDEIVLMDVEPNPTLEPNFGFSIYPSVFPDGLSINYFSLDLLPDNLQDGDTLMTIRANVINDFDLSSFQYVTTQLTEGYSEIINSAFEETPVVFISGGVSFLPVDDIDINIEELCIENTLCSDANSGQIDITLQGGVGSYTFSWLDEDGIEVATTEDLVNVPSGYYTLNVADAQSNQSTLFVHLEESNINITQLAVTDASCGDANGRIDVFTNSQSPLLYEWSTGATSSFLDNLSEGDYTLTITDPASGCTATASATVLEQAKVYFTGSEVRPILCDESNTGSIEVILSGEDATGLGFEWNDGTITKDRNNLSPGSYTLTITTFDGCSLIKTFNIPRQEDLDVKLESAVFSCPTPYRYIDLQAPRLGSSVEYLWSNLSTDQDQYNLEPGQYAVTVYDPSNGCTGTTTEYLSESTFYDYIYSNCSDSLFGIGTIDFVFWDLGELVLPLTYDWGSNPHTGSEQNGIYNTISALEGYAYQATVTDFLGCEVMSDTVSINCSGVAPSPNNGDGNAIIASAVSDAPLSFQVEHANANQGDQVCIDISATTTDTIETFSFSLRWDPQLVALLNANVVNSQFENTVFYNNYYPQIGFSWQSFDDVPLLLDSTIVAYELCFTVLGEAGTSSIEKGAYPLETSYTKNEVASNEVDIEAGLLQISCNEAIAIDIQSIAYPSGTTAEDGNIVLTIPSGIPPFNYTWMEGDNIVEESSVRALMDIGYGEYSVLAQDNRNCTFLIEGITISSVATNDTTICQGDSLLLGVDIPNAVTYTWSPTGLLSCSDCANPMTEALFGPENFSVTVTDTEGMDTIINIFVDVRSYLDFNLLLFSNNPICLGDTLKFDPNVIDGQFYEWTGPDNFISIDPMPFIAPMQSINAGSYTLELIDDIGCEASAQFDVIVYPELNININATDAMCENTCDGAVSFDISGGEPPYQVSWDNGITWMTEMAYTEVCSGSYDILVRDANCEQVVTVQIGISNPISADITILSMPSCQNLAEVQIDISNISGGTGMGDAYLYSVNGGISFEPVLDIPFFIPSDTEVIIIQDDAGCQQSFPINIVFPTSLDVEWQTTNASCLTGDGGTLDIETSGGTPPYVYEWNIPPPADINNLLPGNYGLTITDVNDCIYGFNFDITTSPIDDVRTDTLICEGESVILGATIPDMVAVSWSPSTSLNDPNILNPTATPLATTKYYVTAEDEDGCTGTDSLWVAVYDNELCLEEYSDTVTIGNSGSWCSIINILGAPLPYNIFEVSCGLDTEILLLDISEGSNCIAYQGLSPGTDTICVNICSSDGYGPCIEALLYLTVEETPVWPGDTDTNGIVNNFDLLPIGLAYDSAGPLRPNASLVWEGQPASEWSQQTLEGINYKHIDTDGDGVILDSDTLAITLNWGLEHNFAPEEEERQAENTPFYIAPDTLIEGATIHLPVILGEIDAPANGVYGLAFSLLYEANKIKDGTARFTMDTTWVGEPGSDAIFIQRNFDKAGRLDIGVTRINGINVNGEGQIGSLIVTLEDDILLRQAGQALDIDFEVTNVRIISFEEEPLLVSTPVTNAPVLSPVSSNDNQHWDKKIHLFPNPTKSAFYLTTEGVEITTVILYNAMGKLCRTWNQNHSTYTVEGLSAGVYYLSIQTEEGGSWRRLILNNTE